MIGAWKGKRVKQIRVLLARMPNLLLDIVDHVVASEPDMTVVGRVDDDLQNAVQRTRANIVIVGETGGDPAHEYAELLQRRPKLKVLSIAADGKTASLYEMRPHRIRLGEISPESLREAMRDHPTTNVSSASDRGNGSPVRSRDPVT